MKNQTTLTLKNKWAQASSTSSKIVELTSLSANYYLSKKNDLKQSAKNLYSILRKIKNDGYKMIAVEKIQNKGIGRTINDRLNKASKF